MKVLIFNYPSSICKINPNEINMLENAGIQVAAIKLS